MARIVSASLKAHFGLSETTYCFCWLVYPRRGILELPAEGFTSLDKNIVSLGHTFQSSSNASPTSLPFSIDLPNNALEMSMVFDAGALDSQKVQMGHYDGARIELFAINYRGDTSDVISLMGGELGSATWDKNGATFEMSPWAVKLNVEAGRVYGPLCPYPRLGRGFCANGDDVGGLSDGVNIATHTRSGIAAPTGARTQIYVSGFSEAAGWADYGILRFESGANAGGEWDIARHTIVEGVPLLELMTPIFLEVGAGDLISIERGCDRTAKTCREIFDNFVNFGNFPKWPGRDGMTRRNQVSAST